jgi:hypothetical protein
MTFVTSELAVPLKVLLIKMYFMYCHLQNYDAVLQPGGLQPTFWRNIAGYIRLCGFKLNMEMCVSGNIPYSLANCNRLSLPSRSQY